MSQVSINGWEVIPSIGDKSLAVGVVPGTNVKLRMRKEVLPLFLALAADYNNQVAHLRNGECGAYNFRKARQANAYSDHSSGTAVDLNWSHEGAMGPNGGMKTMNDAQIKACANIKALYEIVIWGGNKKNGGDYSDTNSWDPMHYALKAGTTVTDVNRILLKLGIDKNGVRQGAGTKKPGILQRIKAVETISPRPIPSNLPVLKVKPVKTAEAVKKAPKSVASPAVKPKAPAAKPANKSKPTK